MQDEAEKQIGLECKICGCRRFRVGSTKNYNHRIIRYRYCEHCGKGVVTIERAISQEKNIGI